MHWTHALEPLKLAPLGVVQCSLNSTWNYFGYFAATGRSRAWDSVRRFGAVLSALNFFRMAGESAGQTMSFCCSDSSANSFL